MTRDMIKGFSASRMRIMRFLKASGCELQDSVRDSHMLLITEQGTIAASRDEIEAMCREGLLRREGDRLALAIRPKSGKPVQQGVKHATRATAHVEMDDGVTVAVNLSESPLAMLYRRKGADGSSFLTEDEFHAGERLRADFTRGSLMPSITTRWDISAGGGGHGGAGGMAELTDIALASRIRVERALDAVGPELSGVLIDICCFLKGLERVERERQWPVRSAKMLLKTGLSILHRHYNPHHDNSCNRGIVLHWGTDDYRPKAFSAQSTC